MASSSTRSHPRRDEIVDIATRLFVERGYAATPTRAIAEAAGISQPTLYSHFRSKAALVEEICVRWFNLMQGRLTEAPGEARGLARLRAICIAYVDLAWSQPERYFITFVLPGEANVAPGPRFLEAGARAYGVLRRCVNELEVADPEASAQAVWTALHGAATLPVWRSTFGWVDRERLRTTQVELICRAVGGLAGSSD